MIRLEAAQATDRGRRREKNEDSALADESLFAVADGLGGHQGGEVASALAVEVLAARVKTAAKARKSERRHRSTRRSHHSLAPTVEDLLVAVDQANEEILAQSASSPELAGMGTTLCALAVVEHEHRQALAVVNVGDSRVYRCDDRGFHQITEDHTVVQEMVKAGILAREEAEGHPDRHRLSRALGIESKVVVDEWILEAVSGHRYLLCSDGLTNEVEDREIHAILVRSESRAEAAATLVSRALQHGGSDNVTTVVVDVSAVALP